MESLNRVIFNIRIRYTLRIIPKKTVKIVLIKERQIMLKFITQNKPIAGKGLMIDIMAIREINNEGILDDIIWLCLKYDLVGAIKE